MNPNHHTQPGSSAFTRRFLAIVPLVAVAMVVCFAMTGLDEELQREQAALESASKVPGPEVERDLDAISSSGVLRVLARNNSSSYLVLRGEEYGFEYELARDFAKKLGAKLEVIIPDTTSSLMSMLNDGRGDLVVAPLLRNETLQRSVSLSRPYNQVHQVLVVRQDEIDAYDHPEDLEDVMVAVRRYSSYQHTLTALRERNINVGMVMLPPDIATEEILDMVADGTYPAAVANSNVAEAALTYRPELAIAFDLTEPEPASWAVRRNSPQLQNAVDEFLQRHYRIREDGTVARSKLYNVLYDKYFVDERQILNREEDPFRISRTGRLSPYDDLIREHCARHDLDWRLVASLVFQESRFDPTQESWAGAVGLMQMLPTTAGVPADSLKDPVLNVRLGTAHLRMLYDGFPYLPHRERLAFTLAAYNAGRGHVDDARILSVIRGKDPNDWFGSVRESLLLLRKPEVHKKSRYGYVRGTETEAYVRDILRRYDMFRQVTEREVDWRRRNLPQVTAAEISR